MSGPPPPDLKDWSKKDLMREVGRLRAVMREHAEQVSLRLVVRVGGSQETIAHVMSGADPKVSIDGRDHSRPGEVARYRRTRGKVSDGLTIYAFKGWDRIVARSDVHDDPKGAP